MTTTTDPQADAAAAKKAVDEAEADLVSGKRSVSADVLHKLQDAWRHADLSAQGTRQKAERERREARLTGLTAVGDQVDELARGDNAERLMDALRAAAAACARVGAIAASHDADVAALVAVASDLGAEPAAPGGPRSTSAYIAVKGTAIVHKGVTVSPIGDRIRAALGWAIGGNLRMAAAEVQTVTRTRDPQRPDHLLRNPAGMLFPIHGPLNDGMSSQVRTGSLAKLSEHEIDLYMKGELA
jgi:vacuolar-type H+-ATPase subunit E/Vma4